MINYNVPINASFDDLMFTYVLLDHLDLIFFGDFFEKLFSQEEV